METVGLTIALCVFSALLTFATFYLREIKKSFDKGQDDQNKRLDKIEGRVDADINRVETHLGGRIDKVEERFEKLPETYVFRDDFVRWSISIDKKIDDIRDDIKELLKQEGKPCRPQKTGK